MYGKVDRGPGPTRAVPTEVQGEKWGKAKLAGPWFAGDRVRFKYKTGGGKKKKNRGGGAGTSPKKAGIWVGGGGGAGTHPTNQRPNPILMEKLWWVSRKPIDQS